MNTQLNPITVPPPDEIERRIVACKVELKALTRLKRLSRAAKTAAEAAESRAIPANGPGTVSLSLLACNCGTRPPVAKPPVEPEKPVAEIRDAPERTGPHAGRRY